MFVLILVYVPQGMTVRNNYNILHPEYILNYKYLANPTNDTGLVSTTF